MPYPSQLRIGSKIYLGFGVVLGMLLLLVLYHQVNLAKAAQAYERGAEVHAENTRIMEIERAVVELQRSVLAYVFSGFDGLINRAVQAEERLEQQLDEVRGSLREEDELVLFDRMREHFVLYRENFSAAINERTLRKRLIEEGIEVPVRAIAEELQRLHQAAMAREDYLGAAHLGLMQRHLYTSQLNASRFFVAPDSSLVRAARSDIEQFRIELAQVAQLPGYGDASTLEPLLTLSQQYEGGFIRAVSATRAYLHLVYVVMAGEAAEINYLSAQLKTHVLARHQAVTQRLAQSVREARLTTLAISLLTLLVGLSAAFGITRNTVGPIKRMTETLTALARGEKQADIPGLGRGDEIGAMAAAAQVFKEKAHELENASRYKSEFLANMSHELRTPLNSLLILARIFASNRDGNLTPAQVESATIIHDSGRDLLALINDILDLSKVEAGRMELVPERAILADFARQLERQFRHVAEARGLDFSVDLAPGLPASLVSDWGKVEQVLRNLLSNAFKFTHQGGVRVHFYRPNPQAAAHHPGLHSEGAVAIAVQDSGIGIPADKREVIFEAFRQVDGTTSRQYGGTGLGLSISRQLAELLGGAIGVESGASAGSTFTLLLPAVCPAIGDVVRRAAQEEANDPLPDYHAPNARVLVVDDDERNRFALRSILADRVGMVLEAGNGREALALLHQSDPPPELVLMDVMMPVMDGYQAMAAIREEARYAQLPIIALTAKTMPGDKERCLEAGASGYLAKPVSTRRLLEVLAEWLGGEIGPAVPLYDAAPTPVCEPQERLGQLPLRVLIVDDDTRSAFALARALKPRVAQVDIAQDGARAMQRLEAGRPIDLVLLDIMMPHLDGHETLRSIRQHPQLHRLPVIMLTASAPESRDNCLAEGANGFLLKPVDVEQLLLLMAHLSEP